MRDRFRGKFREFAYVLVAAEVMQQSVKRARGERGTGDLAKKHT